MIETIVKADFSADTMVFSLYEVVMWFSVAVGVDRYYPTDFPVRLSESDNIASPASREQSRLKADG